MGDYYLEKNIKKLNRKIRRENTLDKILAPGRKLKEDIIENIERKRVKRQIKRREKIEAKDFQIKCEARYLNYVNLYNPELVGTYTEKIEGDTRNTITTTLVQQTEKYPLRQIIKRDLVGNILLIEYQGHVADEKGKYVYVDGLIEYKKRNNKAAEFVGFVDRLGNVAGDTYQKVRCITRNGKYSFEEKTEQFADVLPKDHLVSKLEKDFTRNMYNFREVQDNVSSGEEML